MQWLTIILLIPYLSIFYGIYRGLRKLKTFSSDVTGNQLLSVIIACRDEQENLPLLLNDLASQNYPEDLFEVIIIDDNSTDRTAEIASGFKDISRLKVIKNQGSGKKEAIRTGIYQSTGSLIITTDADCRVGREWLATVSSFYETSGADMIVCPVKPEEGKGFFGAFCALEFLALQGVTAGTILKGSGIMCNGANLAFRKDTYLLNQDNLHPEIASGDDIFLLHSIKKKPGSKIEWLEALQASVTTTLPSSVSRLLKQRRRWLSKAAAYDDASTKILGVVIFVTILLQSGTMIAAIFDHTFLYIYLVILFIKSIPDYLITANTAERYGKSRQLPWFVPSQIIYPFYVLITAGYALLAPGKRG